MYNEDAYEVLFNIIAETCRFVFQPQFILVGFGIYVIMRSGVLNAGGKAISGVVDKFLCFLDSKFIKEEQTTIEHDDDNANVCDDDLAKYYDYDVQERK